MGEREISEGKFNGDSRASDPAPAAERPPAGTARIWREGELLAAMRLRLISALAHELGGSLTSILGYSRMMLEARAGRISATQRTYLTVIANSARRIMQTLDGLRLALDQPLDAACFDIRDLWPELEPLANPVLSEKSIELTARIPAQPLAVIGDRSRLKRALSDFLSCAVESTGWSGKIVVEFSGDSRDRVTVKISDTGDGILASMLAGELDDNHAPADSAPAGQPNLNERLALARDEIRLHGGAVSTVARRGEGPAFVVTLPGAYGESQTRVVSSGSALAPSETTR
ncbi:MAG: HAMP domain-containing histidine kinase [Acidobacteria bacterium]|nr:HAMP domain-containing histidine kinase [Acidobacteriota bacterium]